MVWSVSDEKDETDGFLSGWNAAKKRNEADAKFLQGWNKAKNGGETRGGASFTEETEEYIDRRTPEQKEMESLRRDIRIFDEDISGLKRASGKVGASVKVSTGVEMGAKKARKKVPTETEIEVKKAPRKTPKRLPRIERRAVRARDLTEKKVAHERKMQVAGTAEIGVATTGGQNCQDAYLSDRERGVFAVFDGVGVTGAAAQLKNRLEAAISKFAMRNAQDLAYVAERINDEARYDGVKGLSTGVIAKIVQDRNGKVLHFVNVGDSRVYVVRGGQALQVSKDEGVGKKVWNAFFAANFAVKQRCACRLERGDRVVFCTDGVTGETANELMTDEEMARLVLSARDDTEAARNLVMNAKRLDDRTAIVVSV